MSDQQVINLQYTTIQEEVPDFIYEGLREYVKKANTYHSQPEFLRVALAKKFKLSPDWVFLTNGVDEAIRICLEIYGSNTHIFTPTEYSTAFQFNSKIVTHFSLKNEIYEISPESIPDATLIILANPNNPIGVTGPETIQKLIENNPQAIVVIDEVFGEYSTELSAVDLLSKYQNLIIFRGFSKAYGLAGIRLGYILTNSEKINELAEKTTWSNVSYLSCGAAKIALENEDFYQTLRDQTINRKKTVTEKLEQKGLKVIPSLINTITLKFDSEQEAAKILEKLSHNNILVNLGEGGGKVGVDNTFISFAVGTDAQMEKLTDLI